MGFAWWSVKLLMVWMDIDSVVVVRPDTAVLTFTFLVSILTGIVFGTIPALKSSGVELRPGAAVRSAGFGSASALIILQVALSLVLLMSSALLAHSRIEMVRQDLGFKRSNILLVGTDPRLAEYTQNELYPLYRELDERMNAVPGVESECFVQ